MPRRYFNWKLAVVLLIGLVVLGITTFGLRKWQRSRRADRGLMLGNEAYNEHRWEETARYLGSYLAVMQDDVPVLLKYADAQLNIRPLKRNNVQQAIAAYRSVLRTDKNNFEAAMRLTEMYLEMGMPGEAELIATRVPESNQPPELQRILAISLINQRKFEEAEAILKSIINQHPERILAYEVLGHLVEQRPEEFLQTPQSWFTEAVKNNPSSALAYIIRASFYLRNNDNTKALTDLEKAEKLELLDPFVRLRLAVELINANVLDKAETHLTAVQNAEPANQSLWQTWAQLALKSNSKAMMLKVAETGLKELSAQPWDFMPIAAELYIRCDELDRASDCISKLRQKDIAPSTTAFLEGLVADKKGRSYEAVKCWYRAIQLGDKLGRTRLALAVTLSRLDDKQSAIKQLYTLVSEQPNLFIGRLNLARLLTEIGNWAEAAEQARMARQISPGSLDAALLYVQAQIQLLVENQTNKNSIMWQDIARQLTLLENAADDIIEIKFLQLQLAIQQDNFADAEALITELKQSHPSESKVAMAEVRLLVTQEKEEQAISRLNNLVRQFPQDTEFAEYLAILLARRNEQEKCEATIKEALARIEEPVAQRKLNLLLADLYDRWEQQEEAYELLNSLAQKLPNDVPIKRRLLRCEQVTKSPVKAQQLVDNIKSLEGQEGWQWRYEQAKLWFTQDNFKNLCPQIISLLKENLLINSDDLLSRMLLATAYEKAGQLQLAISTYQGALDRSPRDIRIIVSTVSSLYKANEYDRADEILQRAANENLFHPELKRLELQSYLRRGEFSSASDILEDLLANDPNNRSICLSLALLKMRQNHFDEAGELLNKLKTQEPNSLPVTVAQIELKVRQDKPAEALLLCNKIVNESNDASAHILRAKTYAMLGQTDKAQKDLGRAAIIEPNNIRVWTAQSDFYRSIGRLDMAIISIQKAMSVAPEAIAIQKQAIPLFLSSRDRLTVSQGEDILDKALTTNPEDVEIRLYKARLLLAEGTAPAIEKAKDILQNITEDQPKLTEAWVLLAETALRQNSLTKAMDIAIRGLIHRPNDKSLLLLKARTEAARSPSLAIPTLKALQELDPNDADTVVFLANAYLSAGESEKAVNIVKKQLTAFNGTPGRRKLNIALAIALHKNGNKTEAQKEFDSLYQSAPDDPSPLLAQARLLHDGQLWGQLSQIVLQWSQNHPNDTDTPIVIARNLAATENNQAIKTAEGIIRMVLENDSDSAEAIHTLAMLLQITGRFAESATFYQQVLTLQPDNVIAINNLAWILCEEQGKHQQALELARRGLEKAPDYIDLIDTRGIAYYRLGRVNKAVQDFNRCVNLYPAGASSLVASYFHLGRASARLGQREEAVESLNKALELNTKIGGLSAVDLAETQRLLEELSQGGV